MITGGMSGNSTPVQAEAIDFTGGINTLDLSSGTLSGNIGVNGTGTTLDFKQAATETLANVITGTGAIINSGTGTLTLSGDNTYTGGTSVTAGQLDVGSAGALGAATNVLAVSGGVLDLGARTTIQNGGLKLAGGTIQDGTLSSSGGFALQAGTISAVLTGSGVATKTGSGTAVLSGANTYSGGTTLSGGTLELAAQGAAGSATGGQTAGGVAFGATGTTLRIDAAAVPAETYAAPITGFASGRTLDLHALTYLGGNTAATYDAATDTLTVTDGLATDTLTDVTLGAGLTAGYYTFATAQEAGGDGTNVTLSLNAPSAPTLSASSNTGANKAADETDHGAPSFTGTAAPNSTILLYADGGTTAIGSGTANGSGVYTATVTSPLADGQHSITATATDTGADVSVLSAATTITLDTVPPTITAVSDSGAGIDANGNGDLGAGKIVTFTVATSEAVTVTPGAGGATPTLTLNDGGVATYTGGSGTTQQTFSYTVAAGQNTARLAVTQVNPNGATATDAAGNPLSTSLAGASVPSGTLAVDTTAPTITIDAPIAGDNTINAAEAAQGVTISGTTSGAEAGQVVMVRLVDGAGTVADSYTSTLTGSGTYAVAVTAAQAQALANGSYTVTADVSDKAGNPATEATQAIAVNETAPTITAVSDSGAGINANGNGDLGAGKTVTFTIATSEAVTVTPGAGGATPTLTLNDGGVATYTGGSGTAQQTFSYTVAAGQNTARLAVTQVNPNGATATDAAGNPLATSLAGASVPSGTLEVDTTAPTVSSPTLTVAQNAGATPIGIAAPADNLTATNGLSIVAGMLPSDGTVTLADGTTPVTRGEVLTAAQLTGLAFTPTPGAANQGSTFTYTATDGAGNFSTGTAALNIGAAGAPTLAGTHATTDIAEAPVTPFAGVALADPNMATDTLTITLQNGGGRLSGTGLVANPDGTYTLAGSAATVTQQLDALSFTPTAPPAGTSTTTTFVLSDTTSAGTSVTDAGTSVTDTAAAAPPPPPSPAPPHIPAPPPAPDTVSFDTSAAFAGHGTFVLTGTATSPAGVRSVEISAMVDGVETDLGAAAVNANGTFTFTDDVGSHAQGSITATATNTTGGTVSAMAPFDLAAGLRGIPGQPYGADETFLDAGGNVTGTTYFERDGTVLFSSTDQTLPNGGSSYTYSNGAYFDDKPFASFTDVYRPDGQLAAVHELDGTNGTHKLIAEMNGVTLHSQSNDTMIGSGARDRFVFTPGFGQDTVANFNLSGGNHDTLSLASSDFTSLAQVLRETRDTAAGAVIHDAKSPGDTILLAGITKAELKAHPQDFAFHA